MLKYSNSICETDVGYNIPQTTPRRYIIDTKKQKPVSRKAVAIKQIRFMSVVCGKWINLFLNGEI